MYNKLLIVFKVCDKLQIEKTWRLCGKLNGRFNFTKLAKIS